VNGGQGGGYPPPAGGQWPNEPQGGTPYGGQDPYGTPGYGAPGYGGSYGGQGGFGGTAPYGTQYGPVMEPPKKSRTGLIVGLVIGGVVVIGGAAALIGLSASGDDKKPAAATTSTAPSPSSSPSAVDAGLPHSIVVPRSVGDYRQMTGSVADRIAATMRKSMGQSQGAYAEAYSKAKIAIYSKNGDAAHPLIFVGMAGNDSPAIANELKSRSASEEVDSTFLGMGLGDAKDYPAGPLGGVLRCGTGPLGAGTAAACAWADSSTVGAVLTPQSGEVESLAGTTVDLRNAAER
jgi:hypothetical protein